MKIFYPSYYKDFSCIAEKCQHSCCVGWEITVDEKTLEKYERLDREDILCHISDGSISLCTDGRCPFLRRDGLCRLIAELGDDHTSVICREHPRFYHRVGNRIECGIGASCEEAARIILSRDEYADFISREGECEPADETDFDTTVCRDKIYSILKNDGISYREKLCLISDEYRLTEDIHTAEEWNSILFGLEYLDEADRGRIAVGKIDTDGKNHALFERFLAYLVFRHVTVAENEYDLRARLGFCLLLTGALENYAADGSREFADISDFARIISEEIEYSEENTDSLIFEFECGLN